jgi:hypothetical protein
MRWAGHVACMGKKRYAYIIWWENGKERGHLEYLGVDEKDNIKITLRNRMGELDWIDLTEGRDKWRAVVSTVMNLRVPLKFEKILD